MIPASQIMPFLINGLVKLYGQRTGDFSIKMLGKNFIGLAHTTVVTT